MEDGGARLGLTNRARAPKPSYMSRTSSLLSKADLRKVRRFRIRVFLASITIISSLAIWFFVMRRIVYEKGLENLHLSVRSDDEAAVKVLDVRLMKVRNGSEIAKEMIGCMPSVTRGDGSVEYVGNAVKSWGLATKFGSRVGKLMVFDMDVEPGNVEKVFGGVDGGWWEIRRRHGEVLKPRMLTHGDSVERVKWRSKEALDYSEVLERCLWEAESTNSDYVLMVQDDVLFSEGFKDVVKRIEELDEKRNGRWCSLSLFDIGAKRNGQKLDTSNMVARVFKTIKAKGLMRYIRSKYDHSPVDWLADEYCRNRGLATYVLVPNLVRHRGKISSYEENKREGLLT